MAIGKKIEALFLDFDGTMIDSERYLYALYDEVLSSFGQKGSEEEFFSLSGATLSEICSYVAKKIPISEEECKSRYHSRLLALYRETITPFAGLEIALRSFREMELKLFIVTSCFKEYVDAFFSSHQFLKLLIDGIQTPEKGIRGKPHPDLYQQALKKFRCNAETTWVIEDSKNGIAAAQEAKMFVIEFVKDGGWPMIVKKIKSQ